MIAATLLQGRFFDAAFGLAQNDNVGNAEGTTGERFFSFQGYGKSITGGSEGSGSPVGYPAKQEATRTSQPKRAASALQARAVTIEVADRDPQSHFLRKQ